MTSAERPRRGLFDTSAVILLPDLADSAGLPIYAVISAVTLAELSVGPLVARDEAEAAPRQATLQQAESDLEVLPFDSDCARAFGGVAADLRAAGRKTTARAFDAMIAATALAHDLPLFTANPADFEGIDGLDVRLVP